MKCLQKNPMPKLPVIKPQKLIKILTKLGFIEKRQKGSHLILVNEKRNKQITIPIHNKL